MRKKKVLAVVILVALGGILALVAFLHSGNPASISPPLIANSPNDLEAIVSAAVPPQKPTLLRVEYVGQSGVGEAVDNILIRKPTDAERAEFVRRGNDVIATLRAARARQAAGTPTELRLSFQQLRYETALLHIDSAFVSPNLGTFTSTKDAYYFGMVLPFGNGREGGVDMYVKIPLKDHPELVYAIETNRVIKGFTELEEYSEWVARPELERIAMVEKAREALQAIKSIEREFAELEHIPETDPRWVRKEELQAIRDAAIQRNAAVPNAVDRATGAWIFRYQ